MKINFFKYQGTGNDFVMIDNFDRKYDNLSLDQIRFLCDRKFGIGSDGLILLNTSSEYDFEVDYYNSDGTKSFCGNGARCSVRFANDLGIIGASTNFIAIDGVHLASIENEIIALDMQPVQEIVSLQANYVLNTGSPHYVTFVEDLEKENIVSYGRAVRFSSMFEKEGINVNQVEILDKDTINIRTYERGVEDETLSCGTGAVACAMSFALKNELFGEQIIKVHVKGGILKVSFNRTSEGYKDVKLIGPAVFVFKGEIDV